MASAVGVNNNLPWELHWSSPLQSAHSGGWDQYSALRAANRDVSFNIAGDGNCCPRAVAAQIVDNDATVRANPALSAYRVSPLISRDHIGLRAQFVEWLRANAHILQNPKVLEWMHPCTSVSAYAEHVSRLGTWMGSLFLHWAAGAMRTANSEPMLLNYVLSDIEVGLDATRTTGQLFQVLPIPSASGPGSAWPYDASPHLTSAPFASDFCPVRKVSGDYVCPAHGLVVCNSSPGVHWEQCRALPSTTPDASRTRSQMPVVPVRPIFSVSVNDDRILALRRKRNMGGRLRDVAWCLVVCWGARGSLRACRGRGLGVAAGPCLRRLSAARGAVYTGGAPAAVGRGAGWRGGLGCDACAGGRVGVAALGGVATARRQTMAGVDRSSVAAALHALAAVVSTAMITLQQARPLRRQRALQHGRPTRESYWRTPHAHAHCLELPVIPLSFACIPPCLSQALYSR